MHSDEDREAYFRTLSNYTGRSVRMLKFRAFIRRIFRGE